MRSPENPQRAQVMQNDQVVEGKAVGSIVTMTCPICDWTEQIDRNAPNAAAARKVSAILGLHPEAIQLQAHYEHHERVENTLRRHFLTHTVESWVTAIAALLDKVDQLEALLLLCPEDPPSWKTSS